MHGAHRTTSNNPRTE